MTGLILQCIKSIPVIHKTKDHYETTQPQPSKQRNGEKNYCFLSSCHWMRRFYQDTIIGRVPIFKKSIFIPTNLKEEPIDFS